jgi:hypothetical protein
MTHKELTIMDKITIRGARQHNLKNISLEIPRNKVGLDSDDDAGNGGRVRVRGVEEGLQGLGRALPEFPEESTVLAGADPNHLRDREDILAVGNGRQGLVHHTATELENLLLVAGGAEVPPLAGESQMLFMPAGVTPDPGEPLGEVAAPRNLSMTRPMTGR